MAGSKKFFHDRIVLLLLSINVFLVIAGSLFIVLRLVSSAQLQGLIGEYRSNLGLSEFRPGDTTTFISFIIFMIVVLLFHIALARRTYHLRRYFSLAVMGLSTLLITLAVIISNALLSL